MSKPIHSPGPVIARPYPESKVGRITITGAHSPVAIAEIVPTTMKGYDAIAEVNGRLIKAAYNAFDSAARKLGVNAVELAEKMQEGGIVELVETLTSARNWINDECERRGKEDNQYESPASHMVAAIDAVSAKVKGGAA